MSDIRVRGWHTTQKKMYSAEQMAEDQLTLLPTGEFINVSGVSTRLSTIYPKDKFIPLLWTGCRDCKGAEIYDGDIVKEAEIGFGVFSVELLPTRLTLVHKGGGRYSSSEKDLRKMEVIGNVYENPELLESVK